MSLVINYRVASGQSDNATTTSYIMQDILDILGGETNTANLSSACNTGSTTISGTLPSQYSVASSTIRTNGTSFVYLNKKHGNATVNHPFARRILISMSESYSYISLFSSSGTNGTPNSATTSGYMNTYTGTNPNPRWDYSPNLLFIFTPETMVYHIDNTTGNAGCQVVFDYKETDMDKWVYDNTNALHCPTAIMGTYFYNSYNTSQAAHATYDVIWVGTTTCYRRVDPTQITTRSTVYDILYGNGFTSGDDNERLTISPRPWTHRYLGIAGTDNIALLRRVSIEDNGWDNWCEFNDATNFYRSSDNLGNAGQSYTIGSDTYVMFPMHKTGFGSDIDHVNNSRNACYMVRL